MRLYKPSHNVFTVTLGRPKRSEPALHYGMSSTMSGHEIRDFILVNIIMLKYVVFYCVVVIITVLTAVVVVVVFR